MKPIDIYNQVSLVNGKIVVEKSGSVYDFEDFVNKMSKANKWNDKEKRVFEKMFENFVMPQTEKSYQIEKLIEKYKIECSDGVYKIFDNVMTLDDLYKYFWKNEKITPKDLNDIVENIEKISVQKCMQNDIYTDFMSKFDLNTKKKSEYLKSLDYLYPNNNFRNVICNILLPDSLPLFHIFYDEGEGGTGKSTFLDIISRIIGYKNVANVTINNFDNRFMFANMFGKYANIADDNGKCDEVQNTEILKSIVTKGRVTIDRKNISPIEVTIYSKQIFATNYMPFFDFTDGGIMRRMNIVNMNKIIPKELKMCEIDNEELSSIIVEALSAGDIKKDCNDNGLAITGHYMYRFFKDDSIKYKTYDEYCTFCSKYGFKRYNIINFERKMRKINMFEESKESFDISKKYPNTEFYDPINMLYRVNGEVLEVIRDEKMPF